MSSAKSYAKAYLAATEPLGAQVQVAWLMVLSDRRIVRTLTRILQDSDASSLLSSLEVPASVVRFLRVVNEDRALKRLGAISEQGLVLTFERKIATPVRLTAAAELAADQLDRIVSELETAESAPVVLTTSVQPKLLGGLRLEVGDAALDYTLAGRLTALKTHLRTS